MDELNMVEEVVESTTTESVEDVSESTTEESDIVDGIDYSDEPSDEEELLTEEVETKESSNTQKRIDELTKARKLAEAKLAQADSMNKYLLTQAESLKAPVVAPVQQEKPPVYNDFLEKYDHDSELANAEFISAKIDYEVNGRLSAIENEKSQRDHLAKSVQNQADFESKSYTPEIMEKFPDFHGIVFSPLVQFTEQVKSLIQTSPHGHAIAYKLATDQVLRDAINTSQPAVAGKHIGILEQQLSAPINRKLKSKSPEPISSVGNKARSKKVKEEDLPMDEFLKLEQANIRAGRGY